MHTIQRFLLLMLLMFSAATRLRAQGATTASLPSGGKICDMSARVVAIRLVDASGAPVSGASITVRRRSTGAMLTRAESMGGSGDYRILEGGDLPDLRAAGERFDVTFRKGTRTRTVRLQIGQDSARCQIKLLAGPTRVQL